MWVEVELWESTNPRGTKFTSSLDRRLNYSEEPTPKADAKLSEAALKRYTKVLGSISNTIKGGK
jgi:hypothetical protein